ncbi:unnamed protein product [Effrenium voratum]|uniref:Cyclic nucleotide-binding domain-containing protein n=1 Tax=Effrenium voratum TaxID=2562239 RepID=A0AA36MMP1_9DINO|nr:unnamed protein product [Effrenium voratum]
MRALRDIGNGSWQHFNSTLAARCALRGVGNGAWRDLNSSMAACSAAQWQEVLQIWRHGVDNRWRPDVVSYNILLRALGRAAQWPCAAEILQQLREAGVRPNIRSYNTMLAGYEKSAVWTRAQALLEVMKEEVGLDQVSHHTMISAFAKADQPEKAVQALSQAENLVGLAGYNAAIRALATEVSPGLWEQASELFRRMAAQTVKPDLGSFNGLISVYGSVSLWFRALHVMAELQARLQPDQVTWSSVVDACGRGHQWQAAVDCLAAMRQSTASPNVVVWTALMKAHELASQWQRSVALLRRLQLRGPPPNSVSFTSAVSACAQGHAWQQALGFLRTARRQQLQSVSMVNTAISACAASKQWRQALHLLQPDLVSYNAFLAACESQWELALTALQCMQQRLLRPDLISFNSMLTTFAKGAEWQRALALLAHPLAAQDHISCNVAISACYKGMRWQAALLLFAAEQRLACEDPLALATTASALGEQMFWPREAALSAAAAALAKRWASGFTPRAREPLVLVNALGGMLRARGSWSGKAEFAFLRRVQYPVQSELLGGAGSNGRRLSSVAGLAGAMSADSLEGLGYGTLRLQTAASHLQRRLVQDVHDVDDQLLVIPLDQDPAAFALAAWMSFNLRNGPAALKSSGELVRPAVETRQECWLSRLPEADRCLCRDFFAHRGSWILRYGDTMSSVLIIRQGEVRVSALGAYHEGRVPQLLEVGRLGPGDSIGALCCLRQHDARFSFQVVSRSLQCSLVPSSLCAPMLNAMLMDVVKSEEAREELWARHVLQLLEDNALKDASDLVDRSGLGVRYGYVIPEHLKMRCHPDLPGLATRRRDPPPPFREKTLQEIQRDIREKLMMDEGTDVEEEEEEPVSPVKFRRGSMQVDLNALLRMDSPRRVKQGAPGLWRKEQGIWLGNKGVYVPRVASDLQSWRATKAYQFCRHFPVWQPERQEEEEPEIDVSPVSPAKVRILRQVHEALKSGVHTVNGEMVLDVDSLVNAIDPGRSERVRVSTLAEAIKDLGVASGQVDELLQHLDGKNLGYVNREQLIEALQPPTRNFKHLATEKAHSLQPSVEEEIIIGSDDAESSSESVEPMTTRRTTRMSLRLSPEQEMSEAVAHQALPPRRPLSAPTRCKKLDEKKPSPTGRFHADQLYTVRRALLRPQTLQTPPPVKRRVRYGRPKEEIPRCSPSPRKLV